MREEHTQKQTEYGVIDYYIYQMDDGTGNASDTETLAQLDSWFQIIDD